MSNIATKLRMKLSNVSKYLKQLENIGFITFNEFYHPSRSVDIVKINIKEMKE